MKTILAIEHIRKDGSRLHREQLSKSFLKNMVSFLYMQAAQTNASMVDSNGKTITANYSAGGANFAVRASGYDRYGMVPPEALGIRVGTSDVAVTPTDYTMLPSLIPHAIAPPEAVAEIKAAVDKMVGSPNGYGNPTTTYWTGQSLRVPMAVLASGVRLRANRSGSVAGSSITVSIRRTNGRITDFVDQTDLATGTWALDDSISTDPWGQLYEISFVAPYLLHPYHQYAFCIRRNADNQTLRLPYYYGAGGYTYYDHFGLDNRLYSSNSGVTWTTESNYPYTYGYNLIGKTPVGLAHHGTHLCPVTTSGATAQFIIEALFSNYSGETVQAKEVGLFCLADAGDTWASKPVHKTVMVARDVLAAPVDILDGEILRVRYIPTITV